MMLDKILKAFVASEKVFQSFLKKEGICDQDPLIETYRTWFTAGWTSHMGLEAHEDGTIAELRTVTKAAMDALKKRS
jgi:hypothetical protein